MGVEFGRNCSVCYRHHHHHHEVPSKRTLVIMALYFVQIVDIFVCLFLAFG